MHAPVHACMHAWLHVYTCMYTACQSLMFDCGRVGPMLLFKLLTALYASYMWVACLPAYTIFVVYNVQPSAYFFKRLRCMYTIHWHLYRVMHVKAMTYINYTVGILNMTSWMWMFLAGTVFEYFQSSVHVYILHQNVKINVCMHVWLLYQKVKCHHGFKLL